ncbi:hypothetical protein BOX15_Mlig001965g5 [Macrostomum lignano]|uniref:Anoctamin n=1 Tax=Macrostomum lignano TaxID=282301 RepID=A0A267G5U9_9PLAT|nr:hypothetical protein BOX15_Mlig001965g5 [Macrostomum lignano]
MIKRGIYSCAFPPHEGPSKIPADKPAHQLNSRQVLHKYWARWSRWHKYQPLEHIREYFGEKVAFYYAFIGHYTTWLVPASVMGVGVFVYGCCTLRDNVIVQETCHSHNEFKMCPLCDDKDSESCKYWYLSDMCGYILISYLFDNHGTLVYSMFASFWACCFLESWKRQSAILASRWDMVDYIEMQERARPEYTSKCTEFAEDPITGLIEPHFSHAKRLPRLLVGLLSLLFLMFLSVCCLLLMLLFRAVVTAAMFKNKLFRSAALSVANTTSASANFLLVLMLEYLCYYVAFGTTEWEMHRTQTEFENQVIIKVFLFELFNYYLSISYTAFFKANLAGKPGDYNRLFGSRFVECLNGSCMFELTQYLAIIFIFNQLFAQASELLYPKLCLLLHRGSVGFPAEQKNSSKQWESDFALIPYQNGLFWEYLEAVMQFGFVTLFVPAFPLAPLFALINNLVEIRLDARKLVLETRRPRPERAQSIGIWFSMLKFIAYLATISNATLMAFTSEFLPTTVYTMLYNKGLEGYKNFTLNFAPPNTTSEPCRYNGGFSQHQHSEFYWKLMAARIILTLSFQQVVFAVSRLVSWAIPDVPSQVENRNQRQKYLARKSLIDRDILGRRFKRVDFFA